MNKYKKKGRLEMKRYLKVEYFVVLLFCLIAQTLNVVKGDNGKREIGIECVGNYSTWDDLDDLKCPLIIAEDVAKDLPGNKNWNLKFKLLNNVVFSSDFTGHDLVGGNDHIFADNVDLLIYSGHGLKPNSHGAADYSFAMNTEQKLKYAYQKYMRLGDRDCEWLVTFTCNFLTSNDLDRIGKWYTCHLCLSMFHECL